MNTVQTQQQNDQLSEVFQFKKEKFRVEIRKKNLQQELQQRRQKRGNIDTTQVSLVNKKQYFSHNDQVNLTFKFYQICLKQFYKIKNQNYEEEIQIAYQDLTDFMYRIDFDGIYDVLFAIYLFLQDDQKMLSVKVPKVVQSGMLEIFGDLLSDQYNQMQNIVNILLEILCNLTTGSATQNLKIYEIALKDKILKCLDFTLNPNIIDSVICQLSQSGMKLIILQKLQQQTLHIISHFCHDPSPAKNHLIQNGLIEKVIDVYKKKRFGLYTKANKDFYITYTWCLSSVASDENLELNQVIFLIQDDRKQTQFLKYQIIELNSIANELFLQIKDENSAKNLLWYYFRVTHNSGEKLSILLAGDEKRLVIQKMIDFLTLPKESEQISLIAFKALSNYLQTTNEEIIKILLDKKILDGFNYLVETCSKQSKTVETIFWSISNIVLISNDIVKYVISHPIFENIIKAAQLCSDKRKSEAITCLCHLQQTSTYQQINVYYHLKVYNILIEELHNENEESTLLKVIDALYCAAYSLGKQSEVEQMKFLTKLEQLNLSVKLDNLQNYPSQVVFEKAIDFVEAFYPSTNQPN